MGPERMQAVFGEIVDLEVEVVYDRVVYCGAIRNERGGRFSYPVTFILDENGIWKIKSF